MSKLLGLIILAFFYVRRTIVSNDWKVNNSAKSSIGIIGKIFSIICSTLIAMTIELVLIYWAFKLLGFSL